MNFVFPHHCVIAEIIFLAASSAPLTSILPQIDLDLFDKIKSQSDDNQSILGSRKQLEKLHTDRES